MVVGGVQGEAELWERTLDHDAEAFRQLFVLHRDRVFRAACRVAASVSDAEDLTAGAFLELWRLRARVRVVDGSVLPWLLVVTANLARNQRRGLRRFEAALSRLPHNEGTGSAPPADLEAEVNLRDRAVRQAVARLSPADAALTLLTAIEGYTGAEAAAALGISPGTARNRLVRIRRLLRDDLAHLQGSDFERKAAR